LYRLTNGKAPDIMQHSPDRDRLVTKYRENDLYSHQSGSAQQLGQNRTAWQTLVETAVRASDSPATYGALQNVL